MITRVKSSPSGVYLVTVKWQFLIAYLLASRVRVGRPRIDFQDVVLLASPAIFCLRFLENCGRGRGLGAATCIETG